MCVNYLINKRILVKLRLLGLGVHSGGLYLEFCKNLLRVKLTPQNYLTYGERPKRSKTASVLKWIETNNVKKRRYCLVS